MQLANWYARFAITNLHFLITILSSGPLWKHINLAVHDHLTQHGINLPSVPSVVLPPTLASYANLPWDLLKPGHQGNNFNLKPHVSLLEDGFRLSPLKKQFKAISMTSAIRMDCYIWLGKGVSTFLYHITSNK